MTDTVPCVLSDLDHLLAKKELEDGDEIENWFVWELLRGVHSSVFGHGLAYSSLPGRHLLNVLCAVAACGRSHGQTSQLLGNMHCAHSSRVIRCRS